MGRHTLLKMRHSLKIIGCVTYFVKDAAAEDVGAALAVLVEVERHQRIHSQ